MDNSGSKDNKRAGATGERCEVRGSMRHDGGLSQSVTASWMQRSGPATGQQWFQHCGWRDDAAHEKATSQPACAALPR